MQHTFPLHIIHEKVVDFVEVFRLPDEHDKFLLFDNRPLNSVFEYLFCHDQPGTHVLNLRLTIIANLLSRRIVVFSFSELWHGFSQTFEICESHCSTTGRPVLSDRRRLTRRETFIMRVINSSKARCIFSLLGEQWCRERHADGIVIIQSHASSSASSRQWIPGCRFCCLRDVVVVGLITFEKIVLGKGAKVLIRRSAQGICHHIVEAEA